LIGQSAHRRSWAIWLIGLLTVIGGLLLVVIGYWKKANWLPAYPTTPVVMPVPNGFDDLVEAVRLSRRDRQGRLLYVPPALPELRALVSRNRPALSRLRQGLARPCRRPPLSHLSHGFSELDGFRQLALLLVAEGRLAEREGRTADAARSYLDCLRLGIEEGRGGGLMQGDFSLLIQRLGMKSLQEVTARLDGAVAAAAAAEMTRLDAAAPTLADALVVERDDLTLAMLQALQDPHGWRQFAPAFIGTAQIDELSRGRALLAQTQFGLMRKRPVLDGMRGYMTALIAESQRPYHSRTGSPRFPIDPLSLWILPGPGRYDPSRREWAVRDAWWRITAAGLAARAHHQRYGAPPATLRALVPTFLPRVPADPFAPQALRYRLQGKRPVIYSHGPDGDDDGGRDMGITVLPGAGRFTPPTDGDLISLQGMTDEGR
jgi:hypothetical protein